MRKASAFIAIAAGVVLTGVGERDVSAQGQPRAQQQQPGMGQRQSAPLNLQKEQLGSAGLPGEARARMRSGDCAGALDIFDAAVATLTDPTLRRDRGLCHEKLGHIYPAIDDYRAYLTESPDAPDAGGITARLTALQDQASGRQPAAVADDDDTPPGLRIGAAEEQEASKKAAQKAAAEGGKPAASATRSDKLDYVSAEEDALHTPLRAGKGVSLAPLLAVHKWFFSGDSLGDSQTWSEAFGIQVRYSFGAGGALVMEAGYERFNSTSIDPSTSSGLTTQVAYEFRFPFDVEYDNQFLFAPGLGYEHRGVTYTDGTTPGMTQGAFVPRMRAGWRHMLQPSTAFDLSLDLGVGNFFQYSQFPFDSHAPATALVALQASVAWGL